MRRDSISLFVGSGMYVSNLKSLPLTLFADDRHAVLCGDNAGGADEFWRRATGHPPPGRGADLALGS